MRVGMSIKCNAPFSSCCHPEGASSSQHPYWCLGLWHITHSRVWDFLYLLPIFVSCHSLRQVFFFSPSGPDVTACFPYQKRLLQAKKKKKKKWGLEKGRVVTDISASACFQLARGPGWWEKSLPYVTSEVCERTLSRGKTKNVSFFFVFFSLLEHLFSSMESYKNWSLCKNAADFILSMVVNLC